MWKVKVKSLSHIWLLATPWTAAHQAPPSMGFSRQEYWSEVPLPSPGPTLTNTNCCWSWSSNTLATWCKELTHWKRSWCWERLRAGGEGGGRGWDGWMASKTQWPWVWANYRRQWRTGKPEVLQSTGLQRDRHDWATEQQNPWMTPPPWMQRNVSLFTAVVLGLAIVLNSCWGGTGLSWNFMQLGCDY